MAKSRQTLFLSPETYRLLVEYTGRHERFTSTSQSADYLLMQALKQDIGEVFEELLTPSLQPAIRQELVDVLQRCFTALLGSVVLGVEPHQTSYRLPTSEGVAK